MVIRNSRLVFGKEDGKAGGSDVVVKVEVSAGCIALYLPVFRAGTSGQLPLTHERKQCAMRNNEVILVGKGLEVRGGFWSGGHS